jgi:hypothetical protein
MENCKVQVEGLEWRMETIWARRSELQDQQHAFQASHFQGRDTINELQYESKCCWATLMELYLSEAELPIWTEIYTLWCQHTGQHHIMETSRYVNSFPAQGAIDRLDKLVWELETWMAK